MIEHAYIHIPFCLRKCRYCSFVSGENIEKKDVYLNALFDEIKKRYKNETLKTLYIGGGTPSLLSVCDIKSILDCFKLENNTEVTLEVNPETVVLDKFVEIKNAGVNRISLGIQTFNDNILQIIGRGHTERQAKNAVDIIKKAGFKNISIDLIYGLPEQTIVDFKRDLNQAKALNIQHISTYGLKIEEGSYFYEHTPNNIANDEIQAEMYNFLCDFLYEYEHYEISNFAKKGFESKHNSAYWKNKEYYGFGLNAAGYENKIRYKNTADFLKYIKTPLEREEEIILSDKEILENEIFLNLRLKEGININKINKTYNIDFMKKYKKIIEKYLKLELLFVQNENIRLTRQGILLSNEIMSEFIDID